MRSIAWFRQQIPDNVNAPFVAYLHANGLSASEIKRQLEVYAVFYKLKSRKYANSGEKKKKSESDKLFAVTKATKEYVEEEGIEAIEAMVEKADSQLEQWCAEEGGFSNEAVSEINLPLQHYDHADD